MQFMTLIDAQKYLESFIKPTVFERIDEEKHMQDPLDRMRVLLDILGNPHRHFRSIQVSGTSGKGSTSYLTARILEKSGYKTGFATSPHLQKVNERMQVNMRKIGDESLLELINKLPPAIEKMKMLSEGEPSYFELITALAFMHFSLEQVDIAVVEVGMEGKYDATNVLDPLAVILTNISLDHTDLLGNTELEIAQETTSIVRKNEKGDAPMVVTGIKQKEILELLFDKAKTAGAKVKVLGKDFDYQINGKTSHGVLFGFSESTQTINSIEVKLRGNYQVVNASLAIATVKSLTHFGFNSSEQAIREALSTAFFPGRFEVITNGNKTIILDGAHNEAKMKAFLSALMEYYPHGEKTFVVGFKQGKDMQTMIQQLFGITDADFIFTQFTKNGGYAKSGSTDLAALQTQVETIAPVRKVTYQPTVPDAYKQALSSNAEVIIVTGSLYLVGEMREYLFPSE